MNVRYLGLVSALMGVMIFGGCTTTCHCDKSFVSVGRTISYEKMTAMPSFTATVESIDYDHPFFLSKTSVDVWLQKSDGTGCLVLESYPASKTILGFVRSLQRGKEYVFPRVYLEYVNRESTGAPAAGHN